MSENVPVPGELEKVEMADSITVVLVQPQQSLNIGSVARAMMNLGFGKLILVAPESFDLKKASVTARWATPIVEEAHHAPTLKDALAEFSEVVGFGGRYDGTYYENVSLPEWIARFAPAPGQRTALVFGPEDRGLNTEEISHCRWLVRIPSTLEYPSFNLAQAVLLVLYELTRNSWADKLLGQEARQLPTWNDFFQFDRILEEILNKSGFYRKGSPAPIPGVLKRLFQRMNPDSYEMSILLAMVSRINKNLEDAE